MGCKVCREIFGDHRGDEAHRFVEQQLGREIGEDDCPLLERAELERAG